MLQPHRRWLIWATACCLTLAALRHQPPPDSPRSFAAFWLHAAPGAERSEVLAALGQPTVSERRQAAAPPAAGEPVGWCRRDTWRRANDTATVYYDSAHCVLALLRQGPTPRWPSAWLISGWVELMLVCFSFLTLLGYLGILAFLERRRSRWTGRLAGAWQALVCVWALGLFGHLANTFVQVPTMLAAKAHTVIRPGDRPEQVTALLGPPRSRHDGTAELYYHLRCSSYQPLPQVAGWTEAWCYQETWVLVTVFFDAQHRVVCVASAAT